jgi:hypothetical protein
MIMDIPSGSMIKNSLDDLASSESEGFTISSSNSLESNITWFQECFQPHFDKWVVEPIDRLIGTQDALAGFILMTCTIDYLAGFWWGDSTIRQNKVSYKKFIDKYFPPERYDSDALYDSLRNGLVHMFTIKDKKYSLTHNNPELHLQTDEHGQTILNAQDFFNDLKVAKEKYFADVLRQGELLNKLIKRYQRDGFLNSDDLFQS